MGKQNASQREDSINMGTETLNLKVAKRCSQGGVLSPLLWTTVLDELIQKLSKLPGLYVQGFADDIVIVSKPTKLDAKKKSTLASKIECKWPLKSWII